MQNNELMHYGVLGMKWGRRKASSKTQSQTRSNSQAMRKAERSARKQKRSNVRHRRTLSDSELKRALERIKMEKQLKDLTDAEVSPGKRAVTDILSSSGKKVATALVTGAALYGVKSVLTKEFNIKELASYMTPKPKNR